MSIIFKLGIIREYHIKSIARHNHIKFQLKNTRRAQTSLPANAKISRDSYSRGATYRSSNDLTLKRASRSSRMAPLDRTHTTSYQRSVTLAVSSGGSTWGGDGGDRPPPREVEKNYKFHHCCKFLCRFC